MTRTYVFWVHPDQRPAQQFHLQQLDIKPVPRITVPHTTFMIRAAKRVRPYDIALPDALLTKCMELGVDPPVDAFDVLRYVQSPFSLYCDAFADKASKDPPDPAVDMTAKIADAHRERILKEMYPDIRLAEARTAQEAFRAVLHMMAGGTHALMRCPLFHMPSGMTAVPDILDKKNGDSTFGKHYYVVTQIENVEKPTKRHLLRSAFCSLVIGHIQERVPDAFSIVNATGKIRKFKFAELDSDLSEAVDGARKTLSGEAPSPVFGTGLHPWRTHNDRIARESGDVSLVSGVGATTRSELRWAGILTVDDMLRSGLGRLQAMYGIGYRKAYSYMASAKALSTGKPVQKWPMPKLPTGRTEVFLDIQGTDVVGDEKPIDYLLGALVRQNRRGEYFSFVAHGRNGEERMYRNFLKLIRSCQGGIAYHWNTYEATHLKRLTARYEYGRDILAECPLHNLRQTAISAYAFPVPGSGLKDISEWMGRGWDGPNIWPATSALLYGEYVRDPDVNVGVLEYIQRSSRNKCAAIVTVRDWLANEYPDAVAP